MYLLRWSSLGVCMLSSCSRSFSQIVAVATHYLQPQMPSSEPMTLAWNSWVQTNFTTYCLFLQLIVCFLRHSAINCLCTVLFWPHWSRLWVVFVMRRYINFWMNKISDPLSVSVSFLNAWLSCCHLPPSFHLSLSLYTHLLCFYLLCIVRVFNSLFLNWQFSPFSIAYFKTIFAYRPCCVFHYQHEWIFVHV